MSQGDWGIVIGLVGVALTVVFGIPVYLRRRHKQHWIAPTWTVRAQKQRTSLLPVLEIRWGVRGTGELQEVECAVQAPTGTWQTCSWPSGNIALPRNNLYSYVDLRTGKPFSSTIASAADIGKSISDLTADAVPGKYTLRITWYEPDKPARQRRVTFTHTVR